MARSILIKWAFSRYIYQQHDGIRLRIWVDCQDGLNDQYIFAYRLLTTNPKTGLQDGFFSHVCSPTDMEEYGAEEPIPGFRPEWFRLDYVDVLLRSIEEVEALIQDVLEDVRRLKTTLDTMDTLQDPAEIAYGSGCTPAPSSSSSESSVGAEELLPYICSITATPRYGQSIGFGAPWTSAAALLPWTAVCDPGEATALLALQYFDFDELPDDAVITGMDCRVTFDDAGDPLSSAGPANPVYLSTLRAYHPDSGPIGVDFGEPDQLVTPGTTVEFGAADNDWGVELTPAIVKATMFGISMTCAVPRLEGIQLGNCDRSYSPEDNNPATALVMSVELTVYYRCASSEPMGD